MIPTVLIFVPWRRVQFWPSSREAGPRRGCFPHSELGEVTPLVGPDTPRVVNSQHPESGFTSWAHHYLTTSRCSSTLLKADINGLSETQICIITCHRKKKRVKKTLQGLIRDDAFTFHGTTHVFLLPVARAWRHRRCQFFW